MDIFFSRLASNSSRPSSSKSHPVVSNFTLPSMVERAFDEEVRKYRSKSLDNFLTVEVSIRKCPAEEMNTVTATGKSMFQAFTLSVFGKASEHVLARCISGRVQIRRGQDDVDTSVIMRSAKRNNNPLDDPSTPVGLRQERAWKVQRDWWSINGRYFDLLRLSAELRDAIYSEVIGQTIHPYACGRFDRLRGFLPVWTIIQSNLRVLLLNRQVYREVSQHISLYGNFLFDKRHLFRKALQDPWLTHHMKHISLSLTLEQYLLFFGMSLDKSRRLPTDKVAVKMRYLDLSTFSIKLDANRVLEPYRWTDTACNLCLQRAFFLTAWPYLQGHPCTFTGNVFSEDESQLISQLAADRRRYIDWRTQAQQYGMLDLTLASWDRWKATVLDDDQEGVLIGRTSQGETEIARQLRYSLGGRFGQCEHQL